EAWAWNGAAWSPLTPASGDPGARRYHSMVYDSQRGKLIVFGGDVGGPLAGDTWSLDAYAPLSIDGQPASPTGCAGASVTFAVAITGDGPVTFQWRRNGVALPGVQSHAYSIASVVPADAGTYDVVVTNPCGTLTSSPATLTVNALPAITTQPAGQ